MSSADFYRDLVPFHNFVEESFQASFYRSLPSDWYVLVSDINASTKAVESGKYNEVNYLGAACIVAVNNALAELDLPTVFGGDGATVAVPAHAKERAVEALLATREWGRAAFELELRVGVVPVSEIERRGHSIQVAKMEFSPGNAMAMFRGSGFDLADALVKEDDGSMGFRLDERSANSAAPNLESLSCRWSPMPSTNGYMLCLIIGASVHDTESADELYRQVLDRINAIAPLTGPQSSPVKLSTLNFRMRLDSIIKEVKTVTGPLGLRWLRVCWIHALAWVMFRFRISGGGFEPQRYKSEVVLNSDFRKVNGMVRLIIDCSASQCDAIEKTLDEYCVAGRIAYGAHRASHAIMTCVAPDVVNNDHVHYIDGSEGGLWTAAKALKKRKADAARS
jgi:hypothetical protein